MDVSDEPGGTLPPYQPDRDTVRVRIESPPRDFIARLHGGPYDGCAVTIRSDGWRQVPDGDTVCIEDDVDPSQPDARYLPRAEQPDDRRYRDLDYDAPETT